MAKILLREMLEEERSVKVPRTDFYFIITLSVSSALLPIHNRWISHGKNENLHTFAAGGGGVKHTVLCISLTAQRERAKESC